jgi:hypothetical protein
MRIAPPAFTPEMAFMCQELLMPDPYLSYLFTGVAYAIEGDNIGIIGCAVGALRPKIEKTFSSRSSGNSLL